MGKSRYILTAILLAIFALTGCGPDLRSDYDYTCTDQLTDGELAKYDFKGKPKYAFQDLKLLGKLSLLIFETNGRSKNYNVQMQNNPGTSLVLHIYGLAEEAAIDKSACAVVGFKDYQLPAETVLIFYRNEPDSPQKDIVVGLRKK